MTKKILITLCLSFIISSNSVAADSASECFDRLANTDLPFEIYREYGDHRVFFQPVGSTFGLSDKGLPFVPDTDAMGTSEISVAPLCDGNYITVRRYSHHNFPIPLTGRIIGKDYMPLGTDFLISDSEPSDDGELAVATIYPKGFVVTWRTRVGRFSEMKTRIKGRLFDQFGKPYSHSFDISTSSGPNGHAIVRGLPSGGFVVLWNRFQERAYFRVFDDNGRPKTKEVAVGEFLLVPRPCTPYLWISTTKEGVIDVFINCYGDKPDKTSPFDFAQRFDSNGRSLTGKVTGLEMQNLPGYKHALNQYVKDRAGQLDVSLRHDFQRSTEDQLWCHSQYGLLVMAAKTKHLTTDPRLRSFFTKYCRTFQKNCHITQKFEENTIEECTRED